jgi:glycosyltransferase involved in cell wall biosynthesis
MTDRLAVPRHLLLNALFLAPGASGGPETYLRGLAPALATGYPGTRFSVAAPRSGAASLRADGWEDFCDIRSLPCEEGQRVRRQLAEQVLLPLLARRLGADVVHSLASVAPIRVPGAAHVITLHDVTFFKHRTFGAVTTLGMRQIVSRAARNADGLITATEAARDEICDQLGIDPARFTIAPHGRERSKPIAATAEADVRARYDLGSARVVVCVAAKRPHKNQELLVRAAALLPDDVVIVLVGHPEPYDAELRSLAAEVGTAERIRFTDWMPDADLEGLWAFASCAAFPTLGEGFGIPLVESQDRGVPVAASDLAVLREVTGGHAWFFDPYDPASAAAAITEAMSGGRDQPRVTAGQAHAQRYTWANAADLTFSAYERAIDAPG